MALNFGKLAFSTSFNPTSAFPIDARSYFESLKAAQDAARTAQAVGSKDSVYYFGQTLVVVESNLATFYIIQPDGSLSPVGGEQSASIEVNPGQFEFDESGNLSLKGFNQATLGNLLSVGPDGALTYVAPIDAYTKTETDEKIKTAVSSAAHIKRKIVASVQEIEEYMASHEDADQYIFMVPTGLQAEADKYDEYMVIEVTDGEGVQTKYVEKLGSWEVNLEEYAKTAEVDAKLAKKVDAQENARLMTNAEGEKLAGIEAGAQANVINSVSNDFSIVNDEGQGLVKQLQLNNLAISKVIGLQDALNKKVDSQDGYTLLSPTDKEKLDKLVIGNDGIEISGKVNAENVQGLAEWLTAHASNTKGLSENNLTDELLNKLTSSILITSVDDTQLQVESGKLKIKAIEQSTVTGLTEVLNAKASVTKVNEVEQALNTLKTTVEQHTADIADINERLTWQDIT